MLSVKHQRIILKMYGFWLRREIFTMSEIKGFYKSQSAFYNALAYLEESGVVSHKFNENDRRKYYFLTEDGVNLAKILCIMSDQKPEIKRLATLRRWDSLDMKIFGGGRNGN